MGRDTIADIITSIRNADMDKKGTVRIASTNITENIVKIRGFQLILSGELDGLPEPTVKKHRHVKIQIRIGSCSWSETTVLAPAVQQRDEVVVPTSLNFRSRDPTTAGGGLFQGRSRP